VLGSFQASGAGQIDFAYAAGYASAVEFTLARIPACSAAVPEQRLLLPLIQGRG
jgi:hypothetical protein